MENTRKGEKFGSLSNDLNLQYTRITLITPAIKPMVAESLSCLLLIILFVFSSCLILIVFSFACRYRLPANPIRPSVAKSPLFGANLALDTEGHVKIGDSVFVTYR